MCRNDGAGPWRMALVLAWALALPLMAQAEPTPPDTDKRQWVARSAGFFLKRLEAHAATAMALPPGERDVFLLMAAGTLNSGISRWQELSPQDSPGGDRSALLGNMAQALMRLSVLAQTLGNEAASACHLAESIRLEKASRGQPAEAVHCRAQAYAGVEAKAINLAGQGRTVALRSLARDWVVDAIMLGRELATLDRP